ncbi:MAG: hypothetical protein JO157_01640 [Acetobacteraceae bacterium]|nr:hypothetical protein [Acetobacteraceae bacterium]
MLVVFARSGDETARRIAAAWERWDAVLCTPADLSVPGWRHRVGASQEDTLAIGGRIIPSEAITGVLTRMWAIESRDLPHIATSDRDYVAAEMTAFLTAFLSALPCPMLNRPTAATLCGPAWRPEQWMRTAAKAGIPVVPRRRSIHPNAWHEPAAEVPATVTVIGECVFAVPAFGTARERLEHWALALAREAGVGLLGLGFVRQESSYTLASADPCPDLANPDQMDAAREFLLSCAYRSRR